MAAGNQLALQKISPTDSWLVDSRGDIVGVKARTMGGRDFLPLGFSGSACSDNITALAGGAQSGATQLLPGNNRVTTVASIGDSVTLPQALAGAFCEVINSTTNAMQVFGYGTDTINGIANATGVQQMSQSVVEYVCVTDGVWTSEGLGLGYSGQLVTNGYTNGMTANSGGVQTGATPITNSISRFTTVGGNGYSAVLPFAAAGLSLTVANASNNSMAIFPSGTEVINSLAASAAFTLPAGGVVTFYTTVIGFWHTQYVNPTSTLPFGQYTTISQASGVIPAANLCGAQDTILLQSGATALTTPTAAAMLAAIPNASVGMQWFVRIINTNGGTLTLTMDASVTSTGTLTLATNTWRDFLLQITGTTTATMKSIGTGTYS